MSSKLDQMNAIEVAESFIGFFSVEDIFAKYHEWQDEKEYLKTKAGKLQASLDAGGLTTALRTQKTAERDNVYKKLQKNDPRLFAKTKYDDWLVSLGCSPVSSAHRDLASKRLEAAIKDAESCKAHGIPPFQLVRRGTGSRDHYKVMDFKDYAMEALLHAPKKEDTSVMNQKRQFERTLITIREQYGEIPQEMEKAAENVRLTFDFRRRIAGVLEDMVVEQIRLVEHQNVKSKADTEMQQIADDISGIQEAV